MSLGDENYVVVTTFRRTGAPVPTTVCVVPLDEHQIGFYTASDSGKAKRLAHTPRVLVQASSGRGKPKPGSTPVEGVATIDHGADRDRIVRLALAKYPVEFRVSKFIASLVDRLKGKSRTFADIGVVIALKSGEGNIDNH